MFKAKQLEKLVKAGIISGEQQKQILVFDDGASSALVMRALSLLAIFVIGVGLISVVASNWEYISGSVKIVLMFALLFGTAGASVYYKIYGQDDKAEKLLVALFLFVGAAIGLVMQVYQLSGKEIYRPFEFWLLVTLPLLFVAKKKYVAWFWVPMFLVLSAVQYEEIRYGQYGLFALYAILFACGGLLNKYKPDFSFGSVLQRDAFGAFYILLACYMIGSWWNLHGFAVSVIILLVTSFIYYKIKDYRKLRLNIKFAWFAVIIFYFWFAGKVGLLSTGIGLIISGVMLIVVIKFVARLAKLVKRETEDA